MSILPGMDVATGGGGTDPFFNQVQALLHFDNDLSDSSSYRTPITSGGAVSLTATAKHGNAANFPGADADMLKINHDSRFSLGNGDMTVECWVRSTASSLVFARNDQVIACKSWAYGLTSPNWVLLFSKNRLQFRVGKSGSGGWESTVQSTNTVATNTWYHVTGQKIGNNISICLNGELNSYLPIAGVPQDATSAEMRLGKNNPGNGDAKFYGQIDEFRLTMGVARYGGQGFSVPNVPYPDN